MFRKMLFKEIEQLRCDICNKEQADRGFFSFKLNSFENEDLIFLSIKDIKFKSTY